MPVTVEAGKLNQLKLATAVKLAPADWVPAKPAKWRLDIPDSRDTVAEFREAFDPELVAPGTYRLVYRQNDYDSSDSELGDFTIKDGEMNTIALNTGMHIVPQPGIEKPYRITFAEIGTRREVEIQRSFGPMLLKPGKYKVTYQQKEYDSPEITLIDEVEVAAGSLVELEI